MCKLFKYPCGVLTLTLFHSSCYKYFVHSQLISPTVIDIAPLISPQHYSPEVISEVRLLIHEACKKWGFFNVINHNISTSLQDSLYDQMVLFFNSSAAVKNAVRRQPNNSRGFADNEFTKQKMDMKEVFDVGQELYNNLSEAAAADQLIDGENFWPIDDRLINFKAIIILYYEECRKLSQILIEAILFNLNCETSEKYIKESFDQHTSFLRLNYYPIIPISNEDIEVNIDGVTNNNNHNNNNHNDNSNNTSNDHNDNNNNNNNDISEEKS